MSFYLLGCSRRRYWWPWCRGAGSCSRRPSGHVWKGSLRGDPLWTPKCVHPWSQWRFCFGKYSWQIQAQTFKDTNGNATKFLQQLGGFVSVVHLKLVISSLFAALKVFLVMPSPRSALSQQWHRKCHTCRVWRSCTVTMFIYLFLPKE